MSVLILLAPLAPVAAASGDAGELADGSVLPLTPSQARSGSLLLATDQEGLYLPAPLLDTTVDLQVTGPIVRARVVQSFHNPSDWWVEGLYAFPLPETAAVDAMRLEIGDRRIEGEIREKEEARREYRKAKREGRRASLLEQDRPNLFTTAVANIGPGETVRVTIEYQDVARLVDGAYRLRFPMVAAPRYGGVAEADAEADGGWQAVKASASTFAGRRAEDPFGVGEKGAGGKVRIDVELDAGGRLARLFSPSHEIAVRSAAGERYDVSLQDGPMVADRDFELQWRPLPGALPRARLWVEEHEGEMYSLLLLQPQRSAQDRRHLSRETVFIIDTSGSMSGTSIREARRALLVGLETLRVGDAFNVVRFDSRTEALFSRSRPLDDSSLAAARRFVRRLRADGGTEVRPALDLALSTDSGLYDVRQVLLITDGAIGYESSAVAEIAAALGRSRLFTVGIGSAPNAYFMRKAAQAGRGTYTYISRLAEVEETMAALFRRLEQPALTDLRLRWPDPQTEQVPAAVPDVYDGEPLLLTARSFFLDGQLDLEGRLGDMPWDDSVAVTKVEREVGIAKLWARNRLGDLLDEYHLGGDRDELRRTMVDTALRFHLVSQFTSLVAVDRTPVNLAPQNAATKPIPLRLPAGWAPPPQGVPQTATGWRSQVVTACLLLLFGLGAATLPRPRAAR